jgi:acetylornithine/N-succinyldiaminopimelate aminotransferase
MNNRQLFLQHVAPTSEAPLCFEIKSANATILIDVSGKQYIDAIGGISVANIGHSHTQVIHAVTEQAKQYMHTMVYGEMVQAPQVQYAHLLTQHLPASLNSVYFTNSGAEATEAAMKLAKKLTGKSKFIACHKSYHGSTQGALSLIGDEYWRAAYRPLLPNIFHYNYNSTELVSAIDANTAAVFIETIQAESGVIAADNNWLISIREACTKHGTLLIMDEAQAGFGRTGKLWGFEHYSIVPDAILLAKALGGGMPLGALVSSKQNMQAFAANPVLGHITTFGGHPISCAAGLAAMQVLLQSNYIQQAESKGALIQNLLEQAGIECISRKGLWLAVFYKNFELNKRIIDACIEAGVFTDWFLFASNALRISPPLCITEPEIQAMCTIIIEQTKKVING